MDPASFGHMPKYFAETAPLSNSWRMFSLIPYNTEFYPTISCYGAEAAPKVSLPATP